MKVVSKRIKEAFEAGRTLKVGNTSTDGESVYLYGHKILSKESGVLSFTLAGHNTPLTRERVKSIGGFPVYCKDYTPYCGDMEIDSKLWYI